MTKESDETLAVLDHVACALMQTTDDGVFLRVNRVFCAWTGYEAAELVGRRRLQDLLTVGGKIFHQTHWAPLLQMQGSVSEVKLEVVHRDGTTIPMVINALRRSDNGTFIHEVAAYVARDRDRYEQELVRSRRGARDRAEFAEQMIGMVSHDLRTPLTTIQLASELLGDTPDQDTVRIVQRIQRALDRANHLILDLLDFTQARVGSGLSVSIARCDLHSAVAQIVRDLRDAYPQRELTHEKTGTGKCGVDVNRLDQLIGNLVANAVAYGAPTSPIRIASSIDEKTCSVSVTNQGTPIPPATLSTLFHPMTRGSKEPSKSRSVGLGLFIVQEIAKAHGGTAIVSSTAEAGTTFTIQFPC